MIKYLAVQSWVRIDRIDLSEASTNEHTTYYYFPRTFRWIDKEFLFDTEKEAIEYCNRRLNEQLGKFHVKYLRAKANLDKFLKEYGE